MNVKALAMLNDLARSRKKIGKRGGLLTRPMKAPTPGKPKSKQLVRMAGLGHADPKMVISEADAACKMYMRAEFHSKNPLKAFSAVEDYFRASALATNVLFTIKVEKLPVPKQVVRDMEKVISDSMDGIKKLARSFAIKALFKRGKK